MVAEPPGRASAAPPRRLPPGGSGRLGLYAVLIVPVVLLAIAAQVQVPATLSTETSVDAPPAVDGDPGRIAFGSLTQQGAILLRVGQPVRVESVSADGIARWSRELTEGDYVTCGPCPGAVIARADGSAIAVSSDGSPGPAPAVLGGQLIATTSLSGVVLAAGRPDGGVEFFIPTSDGLVSAGATAHAGLDQPLVVVTPAADATAVTIMRASADPLRQGEFEVEHVTPVGSTTTTVALASPGARPYPCNVADGATVAYFEQRAGPTAEGTARVVARRQGALLVDVSVAGTFDSCSVGPAGVVLSSSANGADGDLTRTRVDVTWVDLAGSIRSAAQEQVVATSASVAVDAATGRVAIAGGTGPAVVLDGRARVERPPAAAVAFDDRGGTWWADLDAAVTREAPR